jgi:hypothetical protein
LLVHDKGRVQDLVLVLGDETAISNLQIRMILHIEEHMHTCWIQLLRAYPLERRAIIAMDTSAIEGTRDGLDHRCRQIQVAPALVPLAAGLQKEPRLLPKLKMDPLVDLASRALIVILLLHLFFNED